MLAVQRNWDRFNEVTFSKEAALGELRGAIGFGGMIYNFKNFVLRQDVPRIKKIKAA